MEGTATKHPTRQTGIRLPLDLIEALRDRAWEERRSMGEVAADACRDYLRKPPRRRPKATAATAS